MLAVVAKLRDNDNAIRVWLVLGCGEVNDAASLFFFLLLLLLPLFSFLFAAVVVLLSVAFYFLKLADFIFNVESKLFIVLFDDSA